MAKIPFLHGRKRPDGLTSWHWKPSPRLRKGGWTNRHLGESKEKLPPTTVINAAMDLNRQVEAWSIGGVGAAIVVKAPPVPKKWRFDDLVTEYKTTNNYNHELSPSTRRNYDSQIRQLSTWAMDGELHLREIDGAMVRDLKEALLAPGPDGKPGSRFRCAGILRMLRILMRFAKAEQIIHADPTEGVRIPTPPSRKNKLEWREVEDLAALAREQGEEALALFLEVGFWSMQRQADLLKFNRLSWRVFEAVDPRDRAHLVDLEGNVRGFRLLPGKTQDSTGKWVDAPMPPFLHERISTALSKNQWLFPHPEDPSTPMRGHTIQRLGRKLLREAGFDDNQLRDLRRSGMSWMKDMGALQSNIFAISGHAVLGRTSIVDTYMPPDTKAACAAIAAVCRTMRAIEEREAAK